MFESPEPHDHERLLADDQFIRGLARALVLDPHRAADVAQSTWVAALTHRPPGEGLRAWLATLVRHFASNARRSGARIARRERVAARPESIPSVVETRAKEEIRRALVDEVFALDEPYRAAVVLRFLEGLPPRAIARHLRIPVATVHSRVRRGLEQLRLQLDREHGGDRRTWNLALGALVRPEPFAVAVPICAWTGALVVTTKTKLVLAALMCAALSLVLWRTVLEPSPTFLPAPDPGSAAAALSQVASRPAETRSLRELVAPPAASAPAPVTGSLVVRTLWGDTRSPAAQIGISVMRYSACDCPEAVAISDAEGLARFSALRPGVAHVVTDRGAHAEVTFAAGRECEVTLLLEAGFELEGVVVDAHGGPIPEAQVWLEPLPVSDQPSLRANALPVASTDLHGAFRIRGLWDKQDIWARKTGYAPSARHFVLRGQDALRLVLPGPGAALRGHVRFHGEPVSGAALRVWPAHNVLPYDVSPRGAPYATTRTDRAGNFDLADLPGGATNVQVRARGCQSQVANCTLAVGTCVDLTIELESAAVVFGRVTTATGAPLGGTSVSVARQDELQGSSASAASDGSYRIEDAPPGAVNVVFSRRGYVAKKVALALAPEAAPTRCDAVLKGRPCVRGKLQDDAGQPLPGWMIMGYPLHARPGDWERTVSDREGRFAFDAHAGASYSLRVMDPAARFRWILCEELPPLVADAPEVTITVRARARPSAFVCGQLVDEKGEPVVGAALRLFDEIGPFLGTPERTGANGTFRIGPLAPHEYRLRTHDWEPTAVAPAELARFELSAGEDKNLGTLRLPTGGNLLYGFFDLEGNEIGGFDASICRDDGLEVAVLPGTASHGEQRLPPGDYRLKVRSRAQCWIAKTSSRFTVRAGGDTRLELRFGPARRRALRLCLPRDAGAYVEQLVRIRIQQPLPQDEPFETDTWIASPGEDPVLAFSLGLGAHRIELTLQDGRKFSGRFTCANADQESGSIPVELLATR